MTEVLKAALAIYDNKVEKDKDGTTPLNRPKDYRKVERRAEKKRKRNSWGTKGGHIAPIIVPSTPNGELAWRLKTIAESEGVPGLTFKVVERGGRKIVNQLQKTNPTESPGCFKEDCPVCKQPGGGSGGCHKNNVTYQYTCEKDGAVYTGKTGRNLYTRGLEHLDKYVKKTKKSFMHAHQMECHEGAPADFTAKVTEVVGFQSASRDWIIQVAEIND